ncbi:MAG: UvrB/UvrC motif-containing protein [bacterium]|nr:UvrB/UvrC motif-containing protein [bacterium]
MICQDCKKREAQVHLTQIINNEKMSLSLCKECAAARGFHSPLENMPFPLAEILSGIGAKMPSSLTKAKTEGLACKQCGLTFDEFARLGRFGCSECYTTFRESLQTIMRKIHGASLHRGKTPGLLETDKDSQPLPIREEERLEKQLSKAIEDEDFERAAEIRDKLKTLRGELSVNE